MPTSDPPPTRRRPPRAKVEAYFADATPANLREIAEDTDIEGTPLWTYHTVRKFNANRERWERACRDARARRKPEPPRPYIAGPAPLEPMPGAYVHTLGLWRRWAHDTQRMDEHGVKQRHPSKGGTRFGDTRENRADVQAVRRQLPEFAQKFRAEARKPGVRRRAAMITAGAAFGLAESSARRWMRMAVAAGYLTEAETQG